MGYLIWAESQNVELKRNKMKPNLYLQVGEEDPTMQKNKKQKKNH